MAGSYFYYWEDQEVGPLTLEDLTSLVVNEQIPPDTPVREDDSAEWQPAYEAAGLEVEVVEEDQAGAPAAEPAPHLQPHLVAPQQAARPQLSPANPVWPAAYPPPGSYIPSQGGPVPVQPGTVPGQTGPAPPQQGYAQVQTGPVSPQTGWVLTPSGYVPVQTGPVPVGYPRPGAVPGERRISGLGMPLWVIILIGALAALLGGLGVLRWKQLKEQEERKPPTSVTEEYTAEPAKTDSPGN